MRYISHDARHAGRELVEVMRCEHIDYDERHAFLRDLLKVDAGRLAPEELGDGDDAVPGLYVYRSSRGAAWSGGFGIWAAFGRDEEGVLVVLVAREYSGSDVEHGVLLSAAVRRRQDGVPDDGEGCEL